MNDEDILAVLRDMRDDQRKLIGIVADGYKRNDVLVEENRAIQKRNAAFMESARSRQATVMKAGLVIGLLLALLLWVMVRR
jgi:hypothetical protein